MLAQSRLGLGDQPLNLRGCPRLALAGNKGGKNGKVAHHLVYMAIPSRALIRESSSSDHVEIKDVILGETSLTVT